MVWGDGYRRIRRSSRVGSWGCWKPHGLGRVGSGGFQIHRNTGRVTLDTPGPRKVTKPVENPGIVYVGGWGGVRAYTINCRRGEGNIIGN